MLKVVGLAFAFLPIAIASTSSKSSSRVANYKKILGPNACAECHKVETEVWKKTHHFTTFKKMPRSKQARKIANSLDD